MYFQMHIKRRQTFSCAQTHTCPETRSYTHRQGGKCKNTQMRWGHKFIHVPTFPHVMFFAMKISVICTYTQKQEKYQSLPDTSEFFFSQFICFTTHPSPEDKTITQTKMFTRLNLTWCVWCDLCDCCLPVKITTKVREKTKPFGDEGAQLIYLQRLCVCV